MERGGKGASVDFADERMACPLCGRWPSYKLIETEKALAATTEKLMVMKETTATKMAKDRLKNLLRGAAGRALTSWKGNMLEFTIHDMQRRAGDLERELLDKLSETTLRSIKKRVTERMKGVASSLLTQWQNNLLASKRAADLASVYWRG